MQIGSGLFLTEVKMSNRENLYCPACDLLVDIPDAHEAYQRVCSNHPEETLWPSKSMFERHQALKDGEASQRAEPDHAEPVEMLIGNAGPTRSHDEIGFIEDAPIKEASGGAEEGKPEGWFDKLKDKITGGAEEA